MTNGASSRTSPPILDRVVVFEQSEFCRKINLKIGETPNVL